MDRVRDDHSSQSTDDGDLRLPPATAPRCGGAQHQDQPARPRAAVAGAAGASRLDRLVSPDGALAPARVAASRGTLNFVGTLTAPGVEEVAAAVSGPLIFQLYVRFDREWLVQLLRKVESLGYIALCLDRLARERFATPRDPQPGRPRQFAVRPKLPPVPWNLAKSFRSNSAGMISTGCVRSRSSRSSSRASRPARTR